MIHQRWLSFSVRLFTPGDAVWKERHGWAVRGEDPEKGCGYSRRRCGMHHGGETSVSPGWETPVPNAAPLLFPNHGKVEHVLCSNVFCHTLGSNRDCLTETSVFAVDSCHADMQKGFRQSLESARAGCWWPEGGGNGARNISWAGGMLRFAVQILLFRLSL